MNMDTSASTAPPRGTGAPPPPLQHTRLEEMELRLECLRFLAIFAGAWFILLGPFLLIAVAFKAFYFQTLSLSDARAEMPLIPVFVAVMFVWVWSASTARAGAALAVAILIAVFLAVAMGGLIIERIESGRLQAEWFLPLAFAGVVYVSYEVVRIGWIARRGPSWQQAIIAALPKERARIGALCLQLFAVPPVLAWLPTLGRKAGGFLLFALAMTVFSLAVFILMLWGAVLPFTTVRFLSEAQHCIALRGPAGGCDDPWVPILGVWVALTAFVAIGFCAVGGLRYLARRFLRVSLEGLLSKDGRPPILFLRSFRDDQVRLARPRRRLFLRIVAFGEPRPTLDHVLLEEATPYGPVIAIGAPGSRRPFGAARAYVTDDQWRDVVWELAHKSGAVVSALDETEGVSWEAHALFTGELEVKTLFLLPPRLTAPQEVQRLMSRVFGTTPAMQQEAEAISAFVAGRGRACIGWYRRDDGLLHVLTTARPSHLSYVIAVRMFLHARGHAA
jgi:hypothetical protein